MKDIVVEGKVRRSGTWTYQDKTGATRQDGELVLECEFDKLELKLQQGAKPVVAAKVNAFVEGEIVKVLAGVGSGDSFRDEARFFFLDDLTVRK